MRTAAIAFALLGACSIPEKHLVDGGQGPFECLGKPLPTTAPAQITIAGTVTDPFVGSNLAATSIEGFLVGVATPLFTVTSDADGKYTRAQGTGNVPRDAFLHATLNGYTDTYLYPQVPVSTDVREDIVMFTPTDLATLAQVAQVTVDPTQAVLIVEVVDCNGSPVPGATVATNPPGVVRYFVNNTPSPQAVATDALSGLAIISPVPAGNTTVSASVGGMTLRQHGFDSTAGALLQTSIQP